MCKCTYILQSCCRIIIAICFKMVCSVNLTLFSHMKGNSLALPGHAMLATLILATVHPHWWNGGAHKPVGKPKVSWSSCIAYLWSFVLACLRCKCGGKLELSLY